MGVVGTLATLVSAKRDGFQEPLLAFTIFGGSCGLLYLLYRYIGSRWYDMTDTTRTLITLVCFAIFAGTGIFGWSSRRAFFIIAIIILGVAGVIAFFAGGGTYLPGGPKDREAEKDANLLGISNAPDDMKKKL